MIVEAWWQIHPCPIQDTLNFVPVRYTKRVKFPCKKIKWEFRVFLCSFNEIYLTPLKWVIRRHQMKSEELVARSICIICKARPAAAWTYVCREEICYQTFVDLQLRGKLKEFLQSIVWAQKYNLFATSVLAPANTCFHPISYARVSISWTPINYHDAQAASRLG